LEVDSNHAFNIDELRLYPAAAQMSTFTYEPLVGLTSTTDANGKSQYYDYDQVNRLATVKDNDGNIVKNYKYHYKNGN
jgi:YD repeat-containing protein